MKNEKLKLAIATSSSVFSFPSIVCNKCICWPLEVKLKNVNFKIGRSDHYFYARTFFSF